MSYYAEGFIVGVHVSATNTAIEFHPAPPFLFEDGVKQCLLKSDNKEGRFVDCDGKGQLKVNILRMDVAVAVSLMQSHQKIRIKTSEDDCNLFVEWLTV